MIKIHVSSSTIPLKINNFNSMKKILHLRQVSYY